MPLQATDPRALLLAARRRHALLILAGLLLLSGTIIVFLPFHAAGVARDATELTFQEFSCPNPIAATVDIAGTPYWQLFDPEVPTCTYRAGTRLILAVILFGLAGMLLSVHVTIGVFADRPDQDPHPPR